MKKEEPLPLEADSPWKEALDYFLSEVVAFFFSEIHEGFDWRRRYVPLDKEFEQIVRDAAVGPVLADKLYKVYRKDGRETWLLIHVEIQAQPDKNFPRRMFEYNVRAMQLYDRPVVSLALLCDDQPSWRPRQFLQETHGCRLSLEFLVAKLLDFADRTDWLEQHHNPIAQVVLAHLKAIETRDDMARRRDWKWRLVRGLFERGWQADDVRQLFRLLDWLLGLPDEMQGQFRQDLHQIEQEKKMPYLSSFERTAMEQGLKEGREKGREEGREEGLRLGVLRGIRATLEAKFGDEGLALLPRVEAVVSAAKLEALADSIPRAATLKDVRKLLR